MTLSVPSVTPVAGTNHQVTTGNTPVQAAPANINGGYITNPASATDQGISTAEPLYVDPVQSSVPLAGNGTTIALQPGQTFPLVPGSTVATFVNAVSNGHKFTVVVY